MTGLIGANPDEDWREHVECDWTWPNPYGVVGCEQHEKVFMAPVGTIAWTVSEVTE